MTQVELYSTGVFDIKVTRKIKESGSVMDIQLLDHLVIISEEKYYSMADEGIL